MILITGTADLGTVVIENLLKHINASKIVVLVHHQSETKTLQSLGVITRIADYGNKESLLKAFKGVEKLLLISSQGNNDANDHRNVISMAKEAHVKHLFSITGAFNPQVKDSLLQDLYAPFITTEKMIKESGINYTLFQKCLYMETILMFVRKQVLETGISFPAAEGKASYVTSTDIGEAIANALLGNGHVNKTYILANTETYCFGDIAEILSKLSGKTVIYYSPNPKKFEQQLKSDGIDEKNINFIALLAQIISNNEFDIKSNDLQMLLGRKPKDITSYLSETFIENFSIWN